MQPTERVDQLAMAQTRSTGLGPVLAHGAALLLRSIAIALIAAPVVLGVLLLLR